MTKKNVVWLITKLIGVLFAYWTVVAVFVLISSIYTYISLPSPPRFSKSETPATNVQTTSPGFPNNPAINNPAVNNPAVPKTETETPVEKAKNDALKNLLWNLLLTVIYGLVAWYLIRDGRFLFAVLNREEPYDETGKPIESDSFPLSRKKEEVVTSLNLSGGGKEEITSLNLSDLIREKTPPPEVSPVAQTTVTPPEEPVNPPVVVPEKSDDSPVSPLESRTDVPDDAMIEEVKLNSSDEPKDS
jgi:hypothetical protein